MARMHIEKRAGDRDKQRELIDKIETIFDEENVIDVVAACESVIAGIIHHRAIDLQDALLGADKVAEDIRNALKRVRAN